MNKTIVRVRCVVEVEVQPWSENSTIREMMESARDEGAGKLRKHLNSLPGVISVAEPKVVFIRAEEK